MSKFCADCLLAKNRLYENLFTKTFWLTNIWLTANRNMCVGQLTVDQMKGL